ncbi:MAG: type II toxin-antitoxin system prevent-host-death family antitoxin [Anaerolineae bacterium]|nr:type II toxin-antitoxin system prevent-host-death family antitoxin [Anaerolineae bacterium]
MMSITVPISELKQRTGQVLNKAVLDRQDVVIERYGQEYVVILSRERYQELVDAAQSRVRERFLQARLEVQAVTADLSEEEVAALVETAVMESRRARAGLDAGA